MIFVYYTRLFRSCQEIVTQNIDFIYLHVNGVKKNIKYS